MRRVVVTGLGIVSSIGSRSAEVLDSLRESRSGIERIPQMRELGLGCQVGGRVKGFDETRIPKRARQTMSRVAEYAGAAALDALKDAGLALEELHASNSGVIAGTSFGGIGEWGRAQAQLERHRNPSRVGATGVVKGMHSTVSGNLAAWLGVEGRAYAVCTSFASGLDNVGHAYELIAAGTLDACLCGAAEEDTLRQFGVFADNWGVTATGSNDSPERACRPYDRDRSGTVLAEGAGILLLETMERAARRGIEPYAEIVGYGAANDGEDMFRPSGSGLTACIRQALGGLEGRPVDYINTHGTGTRVHDALEVRVLRGLFGGATPPLSSTKALTGHGLGAAGAQEAVFTLLMMRHGFAAPTVNLEHVAADCAGVTHVRSVMEIPIRAALCFNAGLGGSNACLAFAAS